MPEKTDLSKVDFFQYTMDEYLIIFDMINKCLEKLSQKLEEENDIKKHMKFFVNEIENELKNHPIYFDNSQNKIKQKFYLPFMLVLAFMYIQSKLLQKPTHDFLIYIFTNLYDEENHDDENILKCANIGLVVFNCKMISKKKRKIV